MSSKAVDALDRALTIGMMYRDRTLRMRYGVPGGAISKMSKEEREALKTLTSEDTMKMRLPLVSFGEDLRLYDPQVRADIRRKMREIEEGEDRLRNRERLCHA